MGSPLDRLNPPQREAATTIDGPLLVLAGAGTGKTSVITSRIAYMIESGVAPSSILGVTFTNKAAREMRERLNKIVPVAAARKVTLGTFHSFCSRVLRRDIHLAGNFNSNFSIADDSDQKSILRQAAAELGYSKDDAPTDAAAMFISHAKNRMLDPEEAFQDAKLNRPSDIPLAEIYECYQKLLELQNVVDFDDMLLLTLRIFENHPDTLDHYRDVYRYLLVDEYQDTNAAQFRILQLLAGDRMNICVVGDDDQSIYAWRGADVSNILDFPKLFPGAKKIKLEQNYRSTNKILDAANAVIAKNDSRYEKNLWSAKGDGENIRVVRAKDGEAEALFVVNTIRNLVARGDYNYRDCAILYRSNHLSRTFEQQFRKYGIRPHIVGGQEFFQRKEVKDAAAYLKLLVNHRDDQSLLRIIGIPPRGIGDKAVIRLRDLQKVAPTMSLCEVLADPSYLTSVSKPAAAGAKNLAEAMSAFQHNFETAGSLAGCVKEYLDEVGYLHGLQRIYKDRAEAEKRLENVMEFINYIGQFEYSFQAEHQRRATLLDFIENYSLMDENDRTEEEEETDAPVMSTVHASKGLEWPCVFIVGMEHNLFPHERALKENSLDEERRLFYVAITRARERLFITYAGERFKYREFERQFPSVFLQDLPPEIVDRDVPENFNYEASDETKIKAYEKIFELLDEEPEDEYDTW